MARRAKKGDKKTGTDWPGPRVLQISRRGWSSKEVRELKSMARVKVPARQIARKLGRSEHAVRQKAYAEGVSFGSRSRVRKRRK
jgi:hypothetical protein